jgi:endonuclease VIII
VPEGDTVHLAAARLGSALAGRRLVRTDLRVPAFATADLAGQVLTEVTARGKHLLFRTDAGVTLHTHFRMDGAWHLYRPGQRWMGPGHQVRAVLETEPWVAVGFRLGVVELLPTAREHEVVGHLGPDVLGPDWDPAEAVRRLRTRPEVEIGTAITDQTLIAGPGNVYKSEICFLRGVHPDTPVGEVPDLEGMVALTARLMRANRGTGNQITTGDARRGHERWVYGREGRPCRRCGTPVRRRGQEGYGERVTYWCPTCQPSPRSGSGAVPFAAS